MSLMSLRCYPPGRVRRLAVAAAPIAAAAAYWAWYTSVISFFVILVWKEALVVALLAAVFSWALWRWGGRWFEAGPTTEVSPIKAIVQNALAIGAVGGLTVLLGAGICYWNLWPHPPSDASMRRRLAWHRVDLERIAAMAEEDMEMTRIAPAFAWPDSGRLPAGRWAEYKTLFKRAGVGNGIARWGERGDPYLIVWTWGLVTGGSGLGFVHCGHARGTKKVVESCFEGRDSGRHDDKEMGYRFQRVAPDWYIVQEWN